MFDDDVDDDDVDDHDDDVDDDDEEEEGNSRQPLPTSRISYNTGPGSSFGFDSATCADLFPWKGRDVAGN